MKKIVLPLMILLTLSGCFAPGYPYLTTEVLTPAPWENFYEMRGTNEVPAVK
jgi:hypothetical protein